MEENFDDIDLIDRYLNDDLDELQKKQFEARYASDAAFKKEVEIYRKIYQGIEQTANKDLKKKLSGYYDEYIIEGLDDENDNVRPINWRRTMFIISGIAASVCLFVFVVWLYNSGNSNLNPQAYQQGRKSARPNATPAQTLKDSYALIGEVRLPDTAIRQAVYPQPFSYTFSKDLLTIYGDPLIGLLWLDIFKKDNAYFFVYKNTAYKLVESTVPVTPEEQHNWVSAEGVRSTENIQVQVAPVQTTNYTAPFGVVISKDKGVNSYYFTEEKGKPIIVIQGDFKPGDCRIISLKRQNASGSLYLISGARVYPLGDKPLKAKPLKELSAMSDTAARLIIKRQPVEKNVLSF